MHVLPVEVLAAALAAPVLLVVAPARDQDHLRPVIVAGLARDLLAIDRDRLLLQAPTQQTQ